MRRMLWHALRFSDGHPRGPEQLGIIEIDGDRGDVEACEAREAHKTPSRGLP